jgi:hypothetical protein
VRGKKNGCVHGRDLPRGPCYMLAVCGVQEGPTKTLPGAPCCLEVAALGEVRNWDKVGERQVDSRHASAKF